jgi:hypothetical protein
MRRECCLGKLFTVTMSLVPWTSRRPGHNETQLNAHRNWSDFYKLEMQKRPNISFFGTKKMSVSLLLHIGMLMIAWNSCGIWTER